MRATMMGLGMAMLMGQASASPPPLTHSPEFEIGAFKEGEVFRSRCHMDECVFTKILKSEYRYSPNKELMVRTKEVSGSVSMKDADNPSKIVWEEKPRQFTAVCSYTRPRVYFDYDGELVEHLLTLSPNGSVYGYQVGSVLGYFRACHNFDAEEEGVPHAIVWFGYDVVQD